MSHLDGGVSCSTRCRTLGLLPSSTSGSGSLNHFFSVLVVVAEQRRDWREREASKFPRKCGSVLKRTSSWRDRG
jgi:hypothetical protein